MISTLKIENFKGIERLDLKEVRPITLIGGRNNVGKTTLMEALFLFHDRTNPDMLFRLFVWRGMQSVAVNPESMWAPVFSNFDMENRISISLGMKNAQRQKMVIRHNKNYTPKSIPASVFNNQAMPGQLETNAASASIDALDFEYFNNDSVVQRSHLVMTGGPQGLQIDFSRYQPPRAVFLSANLKNNSSKDDAVRLGQLAMQDLEQEVVEILQIIEPRIIGLSTIAMADQPVIYAQVSGIKRKLPVAYLGDGVSRLLSMILAITNAKDGIVFIDEIENGIHYSVMPKVWSALASASHKYNCQIFSTTHSYECLASAYEGVPGDYKNDFSYIRLERGENGVEANVYDYEVLGAALSNGWEVR